MHGSTVGQNESRPQPHRFYEPVESKSLPEPVESKSLPEPLGVGTSSEDLKAAAAANQLNAAKPVGRFDHTKLNETGIETANNFRAQFSKMLEYIDGVLPIGRERSLATTALEESAMWTMKALSRCPWAVE